ncbi:hypothetical protein BGZ83_008652 [Gryganskiella cystojenkinii]|nr:hypothetical protein BGZ83_008652 [Gryganskiella cystojenkinii]
MYPQPGHYPYGQQPPPPQPPPPQYQPYPPPHPHPHQSAPPVSNSAPPPPFAPWSGYPPPQSQSQPQRPIYQPQTQHRPGMPDPPTSAARPSSGLGYNNPYPPPQPPATYGTSTTAPNPYFNKYNPTSPQQPLGSPASPNAPGGGTTTIGAFGGVSKPPNSNGSVSSAGGVSSSPLYKAEMTETQVQNWTTNKNQQNVKVEVVGDDYNRNQNQQNIKVEIAETPSSSSSLSTSMPRPSLTTPPKSASLTSPPYFGTGSQNQKETSSLPTLDVQAQIQQQLERQSQLKAIQHSRGNSATGVPIVPTQSPMGNKNGPYEASPLPSMGEDGLQPTPVEYQSSLTDITPAQSYNAKNESSLTTLDPATSASSGLHARKQQPYSGSSSASNGSYTASPSDIEHQSALTEIDATLNATLSGRGSGPTSVSSQSNSGYQNFGSRPAYPSAIEEQSSLTEIDTLPHPIEEQSSLTELDNLPHPIEEQSSLTELDHLPHPIEAQSSLTELDTLPYGLEEQSALTELDDLPSTLEAQSSLTEVDSLPHALSEQSSLTTVDEVTSEASKAGDTATTVDSVSPVSSLKKSTPVLGEDAAASFSMSNWTMPTEFSGPTDWPDAEEQQNKHDTEETASSPPGSGHHARSPAMHINTSTKGLERSDSNNSGSILIPLSPTTAASSGSNSPWNTLSPSNSFKKKTLPLGKTPVPPPKPASMLAAKKNSSGSSGPQAGYAGAKLTVSEEINLTGIVPPAPAPSATPDALIYEHDEDDKGSLEDGDDEDLEPSLLDDGVSAFIKELQSSIPLSRSGSGTSAAGLLRKDKKDDSTLKQIDSSGSGSRRSQQETVVVAARELPEPRAVPVVKKEVVAPAPPPPPPPVHDEMADGGFDLQQLEATQFEWTFTESEQSTYERIFGLWERPAEDCVSADIAGKVFMTLGLQTEDLRKIWQLLNPDDRPILSRTQFIAGLHLVNCQVVGYELPDDLPDELMMSAAAVGRIVIPARPTQGPSIILPGATDFHEPVSNEYSSSSSQPPYIARPVSPKLQSTAVTPSPMQQPTGSNFMFAYSGLPSYNSAVEQPSPIPSYMDAKTAEPVYQAYPYQQQQQQQQQLQQQQQSQPSYNDALSPGLRPTSPMPRSVSPRPTSTFGTKSGSNSNASSNNDIFLAFPTDYKPGPHALHNPGAEAPIRLSFDDDEDLDFVNNNNNNKRNSSLPFAPVSSSTATTMNSNGSSSSSVAPVPVKPVNHHSVDNPALYASPPDAWDHDAAPPELDVEGNYIRYRSDFKNDMTVSASVTANHPINPKSGIFYFEIFIESFKGNSAISVGIASKALRKNCQVGWDLNSWGYHSDDGFLYFGNGKQNIQYSYDYGEGFTVGCGVNFLDRSIFFTLNGEQQGVAFKFLKDSIPLYPAIGLSQAGTEINANFGDQTFLFDIVGYKKAVMSKPIRQQPFLVWSDGQRNDKVFSILGDGLSVIASGSDAGCIRGPKVSPRDKNVFYFEITILYLPKSELGTLMIGICGKDQKMTDILGWKPNSYGYSSESGDFLSISSDRSSMNAKSLSGKMKARARGPPFRSGSVVGCGLDFASRELFFTINGECLGQAFFDLDVLDCFPCVSVVDGGGGGVGGPLSMLREDPSGSSTAIRTNSLNGAAVGSSERTGFEFKANFGQFPFMFDLQAFEASEGQA